MKTAILLFNLGGPDGPDAVQPFLFNLFNDKAIIGAPAPIRWLIAKLISTRRAPVAKEIYSHLGGASPLLPNTIEQGDALKALLNPNGSLHETLGEVRCFPVMRYWTPFSDTVAAEVKAWGADQEILLPLYPQFSTATTESSVEDWVKARKKAGLTGPTTTICCFPEDAGFVAAGAKLVKEAVVEVRKETGQNPRVFFSAHGLPKKTVEKGDPYQWQVEQSAAAMAAAVDDPDLDWKVTYQSRVGPLEWIKPYTEDEIIAAGHDKVPLVIVPVAFVSEHSETLVELDIEYGELAEEHGVPHYHRVPTVSVSEPFIKGLADLVVTAADRGEGLDSGPGGRLCPGTCVRCPNKNDVAKSAMDKQSLEKAA